MTESKLFVNGARPVIWKAPWSTPTPWILHCPCRLTPWRAAEWLDGFRELVAHVKGDHL